MSQIVYYDANPTVRQLMMRMFGQYGLEVVVVPCLEKCEEIFAACSHPVAFIADLSRQPDFFPTLQNVVPKYIRAPERCILTSVQPPALAPFLPDCLDNCFFKHVVERPFKRLDFIHFFEDIIKPYIESSKSIVLEHIKSCVNSSVDQITGPFMAPNIDEGLEKQVEGIVQSSSNAIPINQLVEEASSNPSNNEGSMPAAHVQRCNNRMSRRSRAASFDSQVKSGEKINPLENSRVRMREQVRNPRESSYPRQESSNPSVDSHLRAIPTGRKRPVPAPHSDENVLSVPKTNDIHDEFISPVDTGMRQSLSAPKKVVSSAPKAVPANPYMRKDDLAKAPTIPTTAPSPDVLKNFAKGLSEEEEDESTMLVSPAIVRVSMDQSAASPSLIQTGESTIRSVFEVSWLKSILKMSLVRQQQYTVVSKYRNDTLIVLIKNGYVEWLEKLVDAKVTPVSEFLASVPPSENLPLSEIINRANRNIPLTDVFISLGLDKQLVNISRRTVHMNMRYFSAFDGKPVEVFLDVPDAWRALCQHRPVYPVDIIPFLFDELRENSDSLIVPQYLLSCRFAMRPWRTPQNVGIELTPAENDILCMLQTPSSIADLRRSGRRGIAEIVYRLALFELVDFVQ